MMGNSGLKQHYDTASKTGVLQISDQKLKEIPGEVIALCDILRSLDLSKNKLVHLPDDISKLKSLKQLNVESNRIETLPNSLASLKKLELLNLAHNSLTALPQPFSNLSSLKHIYLNNNNFRHFPIQLFGLKNVEVVDISHNKITELPSGMCNLYAVELNLSQNELSCLGDDLYQAPRLKILKLDENCLSLEAIRPRLLRDSRLHTLSLEGNLFETKQVAMVEGYNEYIERYTAMKKKMF